MLMAHTMQIRRPEQVQRVFDLKGSTMDRKVKMTKQTNGLKTLKDENFTSLNKQASQDLVIMYESDRAFVTQQLRRDSAFLRCLNIMDYSLLLCIEHIGQPNASFLGHLDPDSVFSDSGQLEPDRVIQSRGTRVSPSSMQQKSLNYFNNAMRH